MSEIKNCLECPKDKTCSSWYGGSMCTKWQYCNEAFVHIRTHIDTEVPHVSM